MFGRTLSVLVAFSVLGAFAAPAWGDTEVAAAANSAAAPASLAPGGGAGGEAELAAILAALASEAPRLGAGQRERIGRAVLDAANEHSIPAFLLLALIAQESGFDPGARNARAVGLMQVDLHTARVYAAKRGLRFEGESALRDPARNVAIGSGYLGQLRERFGSTHLALAAYNKGPEAVRRDLHADREPGQHFVAEVIRLYEHYEARFGGI